jgi:hypothetical protein
VRIAADLGYQARTVGRRVLPLRTDLDRTGVLSAPAATWPSGTAAHIFPASEDRFFRDIQDV